MRRHGRGPPAPSRARSGARRRGAGVREPARGREPVRRSRGRRHLQCGPGGAVDLGDPADQGVLPPPAGGGLRPDVRLLRRPARRGRRDRAAPTRLQDPPRDRGAVRTVADRRGALPLRPALRGREQGQPRRVRASGDLAVAAVVRRAEHPTGRAHARVRSRGPERPARQHRRPVVRRPGGGAALRPRRGPGDGGLDTLELGAARAARVPLGRTPGEDGAAGRLRRPQRAGSAPAGAPDRAARRVPRGQLPRGERRDHRSHLRAAVRPQ